MIYIRLTVVISSNKVIKIIIVQRLTVVKVCNYPSNKDISIITIIIKYNNLNIHKYKVTVVIHYNKDYSSDFLVT